MELGLTGRAALVGGASAGLGRACAERLAAEGCRLALWSRGGDRLEQTAAEIRRSHSVEVTTIAGDAADPSTAAIVAAEAAAAFGQIDIVVLNAGGPPPAEATRTDPVEWRRSFQLLAITPIELATLLLPAMRSRGWGRIVSILSSGVRQPIPELAYSNACRSALVAWLKTIAPEVIADGVTVNGVLPGRLDTARVSSLDLARAERIGETQEAVREQLERAIPAGRYGKPDELGAYVAWLCSDPARYQTGTFVSIDGGSLRALP
jgi:3-oxoacyl-[acyl-carrier protein] reductase